MKHSFLFLLTLSVSLSMVCLPGGRAFSQNLPPFKARWVGKPFPSAIFTDADHRTISTEELKGMVLVVNCWNLACGPCIGEIPDLNRLVDSLDGKKVVFLALSYDKFPEIKAFFHSQKCKEILHMEEPAFKFRLIGEQKDFLDKLGVGAYPTTFIVGGDGIIRDVIIGVTLDQDRRPRCYEKIRAAIDHLMQ
ncbi:MAG TPA: TlpA disulfide reductase family protein [Puia sp.]